MPGIGFFRESQEKQQAGIKLATEYQQANHLFNQSFLRVSIESLQTLQKLIPDLNDGKDSQAPSTLRGIYDLWVEVSEASYADFAMSEEYQILYGDMVNRLMKLKKHHSEMLDDTMASMNLPTRKEIDTMQERLQQTRRDNNALRRELKEIRAMLAAKNPLVKKASVKKAAVKKSTPINKKATVKKSTPTKKKSAKPSTRTKKGA
jgi:class III poly(R)-hydroxyalkanoic acid synthase PhaE subunit